MIDVEIMNELIKLGHLEHRGWSYVLSKYKPITESSGYL